MKRTSNAKRSPFRSHLEVMILSFFVTFVVLQILVLRKDSNSAQAQSGVWSQPVMLSTNTVNSWFPDIAVDRMGKVHVVWDSSAGKVKIDEGDTFVLYSVWDGQEWSEPNDLIVDMPGAIMRPSVAVDNVGNLYLLYSQNSQYHRMAPVDKAMSAVSWSQPHVVSTGSLSYTSDMAVDSQGIIHTVWDMWVPVAERTDESGAQETQFFADVFYRRSTDGGQTWSYPINLSNSPMVGDARAQLEIDAKDTIHVVWDEGWDKIGGTGFPARGVYVFSKDGGESWSLPTVFSYPEATNAQMTIASDGQGGVMAVWRATSRHEIYYDWSSDGGLSWSAPAAIPGIYARPWRGIFDIYDMGADSAGNIHFVGVGGFSPSEDTLGVYHVVWDGSSWSTPVEIYRGGFPEYLRLAISKGNELYAVWFDRYTGSGATAGGLQVWYSNSRSSAPPQTPMPMPTATPMATFTPRPSPTPTYTPFPTLVPGTTGVPEGLYTEGDEVLRLAIALSPVPLLFILIAAIVKARRLKKLS